MSKMIRLITIVIGLLLLCMAPVKAASYNVNAVVPADPPTVAPHIITPVGGFDTTTNSVGVGGSCEIMTSAIVVSIWRDGSSIGSTMCDANGSFFVIVSLVVGINRLEPRSSSFTGQFGPAGTPVSITYALPVPPTLPQNPEPISPSSSSSVTSVTVVPTQTSPPILSSQEPFYYFEIGGDVVIRIMIKNGESPYDLIIDWGDGTKEAKKSLSEGLVELRHRYARSATYSIRAKVTDVRGISSVITLSSISLSSDSGQSAQPEQPLSNLWPLALLLISIALGLLAYVFRHQTLKRKKTQSGKKR